MIPSLGPRRLGLISVSDLSKHPIIGLSSNIYLFGFLPTALGVESRSCCKSPTLKVAYSSGYGDVWPLTVTTVSIGLLLGNWKCISWPTYYAIPETTLTTPRNRWHERRCPPIAERICCTLHGAVGTLIGARRVPRLASRPLLPRPTAAGPLIMPAIRTRIWTALMPVLCGSKAVTTADRRAADCHRPLRRG